MLTISASGVDCASDGAGIALPLTHSLDQDSESNRPKMVEAIECFHQVDGSVEPRTIYIVIISTQHAELLALKIRMSTTFRRMKVVSFVHTALVEGNVLPRTFSEPVPLGVRGVRTAHLVFGSTEPCVLHRHVLEVRRTAGAHGPPEPSAWSRTIVTRNVEGCISEVRAQQPHDAAIKGGHAMQRFCRD